MVGVVRGCDQQGGGPRPLSPLHPGHSALKFPDLVLEAG